MRYFEIMEGKWWDESPTITLFHGTSSAFLENIETHGLCPPSEDMRAYAYEILEQYIPKEKWAPKLLKMVDEHAARIGSMGRTGDRGSVLYFFSDLESVKGYAQAYAEYGGEIACDVHRCACLFLKPRARLIDLKTKAPIKPRFIDSKPIVVEVEIPKSWSIFNCETESIKRNTIQAWEANKSWARKYNSLNDLLDNMMKQREVRVARIIPPEMITKIHFLSK